MINPDGVIHGSSRCNLAGFDLNRQWGDFLIKVILDDNLVIHSINMPFKKYIKSNSLNEPNKICL